MYSKTNTFSFVTPFKYCLSIAWLSLLIQSGTFAQSWGDYTLYSVQNSSTATLLDNSGNVYHTWAFNTDNKTGYSAYLLPGGDLIRTIKYSPNYFQGGGETGKFQKADWNGNVTWEYVYSTTNYAMHHDICPMPNGHVLLISYDLRSASEAEQAGCSSNMEIWSEKIVEIMQTGPTTGEIVWVWYLWDHLVQNHDATKSNYAPSISDHPELLNINYKTQKDWLHMNGIDYNPILDQITFSSHNLNEIYVIDHSTSTAEAATHQGGLSGQGGDFLYRWGNPVAYSMSGQQILYIVHDAHWSDDQCATSGQLVAFNNRGTSNKSTIDFVDVPLDGYNYTRTAGAPFQPLTYSSRYICNGSSSSMGNSQQLPNNNMLVCIATAGSLYEVNSAGTTLWSKNISGVSAQAFRYEDCYLTATQPEVPVITLVGNTLQSSDAAYYQWYLNGKAILGATSQTYTPSLSGHYLVRTAEASQCVYNYSQTIYYTYVTATNDLLSLKSISIGPNPTTGLIKISTEKKIESVAIFDLQGRHLSNPVDFNSIDLSDFSTGTYLIRITCNDESRTFKIMLNK